jgi:hypothetical protein
MPKGFNPLSEEHQVHPAGITQSIAKWSMNHISFPLNSKYQIYIYMAFEKTYCKYLRKN